MPIKQRVNNIKKSERDELKYRIITLENNLTALLVRDTDVQECSAAMAVHAGSLKDPDDCPGLAHLLEHMLFMGSEKYPSKGEYSRYMAQNGGWVNAFTSDFHANYHFECSVQGFYEALDRFAQFFISPLMSEESVAGEIKAINSEYLMNLGNDTRRLNMLVRSFSEEGAANRKFRMGNIKTLKRDGIVEKLKNFYENYYSANTMGLVVFSPKELDEVEIKVDEIFSKIENKNLAYQGFSKDPFPYKAENMKKLIKVVPVSDVNTLTLLWILPSHYPLKHKKKLLNYYSTLFSHRSEGSILNFLQKEGLATAVSSSKVDNEDYFSELSLQASLTRKGLKEWKKVVEVIGAYISMLKKAGPQEWFYQERKDIAELGFTFPSKMKGSSICKSFAISLIKAVQNDEDLDNILYDRLSYGEFDETALEMTVEEFTIDNALLILSSKEFKDECKEQESYYRTKYSVEQISEEVVQLFRDPTPEKWSTSGAQVGLPERNTLIPKKFVLLPPPEKILEHPQRIVKNGQTEVWHQQDARFRVPKVKVNAQIYTKSDLEGVPYSKYMMFRYLWVIIFNNFRSSTNYLASMAGCKFAVSVDHLYIAINGNCYSQSLQPFLDMLLDYLEKFKDFGDKQQFEDLKEGRIQALNNSLTEAPDFRGFDIMYRLLIDRRLSFEQSIEATKALTFEEFVELNQKIFSKVRFEWIIEGNIDAKTTKEITARFEERFRQIYQNKILEKHEINQQRIVKIQPKRTFIVEKDIIVEDEPNSCFIQAFQVGQGFEPYFAYTNFLSRYLNSEYYEELTTNQQLGYVADSVPVYLRGVYFFVFCAQSPVKNTEHIRVKTLEFLNKTKLKLVEMTEEKFEQIRAGCLSHVTQGYQNWSEKYADDMYEVMDHTYMFDRRKRKEQLFKGLTKEGVVEFYQKIFFDEARVLELHQYSMGRREEGERIRERRLREEPDLIYCDSDASFKAQQGFFVDKLAIIE